MPENLIGNLFQSASEENSETANIEGIIPDYATGVYIRNGPGKFDLSKEFTLNNYLDGYAVLTKFDIGKNSVTLSKKFLESDAYKKAIVAKKPQYVEFGTKAYGSADNKKKGFLSRLIADIIPSLSDNGNISLFKMHDHLIATGETGYLFEIDPHSLCCLNGIDTFKAHGLKTLTPHSLKDKDGTIYNIGMSMSLGFLKYKVIAIPPSSSSSNSNTQDSRQVFNNARTVCTIPSPSITSISYLHSFGLTENYIILIEQPLVLNVTKVLTMIAKGSSLHECMDWRGNEMKNRFHVIEKKTGKVLVTEYYSANAFFFLHIINCYETTHNCHNQIVIDLMTFENADVLNSFQLNKLRKGILDDEKNNPLPQRFVIPVFLDIKKLPENTNLISSSSSTIAIAKRIGNQVILSPENLVEHFGLELPAINTKFIGQNYKYFYGSGSLTNGYFANSIAKVNTESKEIKLWRESEHYYFGEPLFIENPEAQEEDEGVIISAVTDSRKDFKDFLLFLNAANFKQIAKVYFQNSKIPLALHSTFLPKQNLPKL